MHRYYADFRRGKPAPSLTLLLTERVHSGAQELSRWLGERGYRGEGEAPTLPDDLRCEAARRYIETFELVTGQPFEADTEAPLPRMRRNLGL